VERRSHWLVGVVTLAHLALLLRSTVELRPLIGTGADALSSGLTALVLAVASRGAASVDRRLRLDLAFGMTCA
jgi:hypothetical protein